MCDGIILFSVQLYTRVTSTIVSCTLGVTWLMVYRTEKYQKLKAEVEKQSKKRECIERAFATEIATFLLLGSKKTKNQRVKSAKFTNSTRTVRNAKYVHTCCPLRL